MTTKNIPAAPVYIGGPMAGYDDFNRPAFLDAERLLRERGVTGTIFNPATFDDTGIAPADETPWNVQAVTRARYLKRGFYYLSVSESLVLLDGWDRSTGATAEFLVARLMGLPVWRLSEDERLFEFLVPYPYSYSYGRLQAHAEEVVSARLSERLSKT